MSLLQSADPEFGSFHHQYRLDGVLVAVGVVDVLPSSLSSVYFFYDPSLHHLSLGIWSALQEVEWVKRFAVRHPDCHYYAMGLYVHSCPKMRYKSTFFPSQLLCPVRYTWHAVEAVFPYLDHHRFVVFSDIAPPFTPPVSTEHGNKPKRAGKTKSAALPPTSSSSSSSTSSSSSSSSSLATSSSTAPILSPPAVDSGAYTVKAETLAEQKRQKSAR